MRLAPLFFAVAGLTLAQPTAIGVFTNPEDIGAPQFKGAAEFDAASGQYEIAGTGADIWSRTDQFHCLWKCMSGNFAQFPPRPNS